MIETHLNIFDAIVLGILALSCLFAFFRGFVREVLSLSAWLGAAVITIYYFPTVTNYIKPHFKNPIGAAGIATLAIYTVSLIFFSIINSIIIKYLKSGSDVGMVDNLLGLAFGLARGALIICLGYFMLTIAMPEKEYPDWLKQSVSRPYVEMGAIKLAKVAPDYLREISTLQKKAMAEMETTHPRPRDDDDEPVTRNIPHEDPGYPRSSTRQMDRLIEGNR